MHTLYSTIPKLMANPQCETISDSHRKGNGTGKWPAIQAVTATSSTLPSNSPCGVCKFLRRKCISGCIFAPHFGTDQGAAWFAAVHKVFGASTVSKLLLHIPINRWHDAIATLCYEAQARLSDPEYGCVSTIIALQQQVASLQAELTMIQAQLISSRLAIANAKQQKQHHHQIMMAQPAHSNISSTSNTSSTSNNFINMSSFNSSLELIGQTTTLFAKL